jgi:hypothetical protein
MMKHAARMGEMRNSYKMSAEKPEVRDHREDYLRWKD